MKTPLTHSHLRAVIDGDIGTRKSEVGSAHDRFSSPAPGTAKRHLFNSTNDETTAVCCDFMFLHSSNTKSPVALYNCCFVARSILNFGVHNLTRVL